MGLLENLLRLTLFFEWNRLFYLKLNFLVCLDIGNWFLWGGSVIAILAFARTSELYLAVLAVICH